MGTDRVMTEDGKELARIVSMTKKLETIRKRDELLRVATEIYKSHNSIVLAIKEAKYLIAKVDTEFPDE